MESTKLLSPLTSETPIYYKRKTTKDNLHRSKRIFSNFDVEISLIKKKFIKDHHVLPSINNVINQYWMDKKDGDQSFIILPGLLEIAKNFISIQILYCELNEIKSKIFLKKFHKFSNNGFRIAIMWNSRNKQSSFPLKDKNHHELCVIYKGLFLWFT